MPVKSGISHTVAAFVALVLGSVLKSFLNSHAPELRQISETVGFVLADVLVSLTGLQLSETVAGMLGIVFVLTFLWGWFYHVARHS